MEARYSTQPKNSRIAISVKSSVNSRFPDGQVHIEQCCGSGSKGSASFCRIQIQIRTQLTSTTSPLLLHTYSNLSPLLPHLPSLIPHLFSLISHPHTPSLLPHPSPLLPHLTSLTSLTPHLYSLSPHPFSLISHTSSHTKYQQNCIQQSHMTFGPGCCNDIVNYPEISEVKHLRRLLLFGWVTHRGDRLYSTVHFSYTWPANSVVF